MTDGLATARAAAHKRTQGVLTDLENWLRIASVSGDPSHRADVSVAARWIANRLSRSTRRVQVASTPSGPLVVARIPAARPGAGTVVVYGHFDVKPAGPGWTSSPFEPVRRGGLLFARGSSDDKGQVMAHIAAIEAWVSAGGPPVDVVVVLDGAEEIGSPGLESAVARPGVRAISGDSAVAVVVSDTRMAKTGTPSVTVSQRGTISLSVRLDTGHGAVHAGRYGGAVIDPTVALATSIARASRTVGALTGPVLARSPTDDDVRAGAGGRALYPGPIAERTTTRGALTVSSFDAGSAPGSIPAAAKATLDVRLPPNMDPVCGYRLVAGALRRNAPANVEIQITCTAFGSGITMRQSSAIRRAIDDACLIAFGCRPINVASGGSIHAVGVLARTFHKAPILLGLGPPDDRAHGPDERLNLGDWVKGVDACVCLLDFLASARKSSQTRMHEVDLGTTLVGRGIRGPQF
jgi:succinyl-diaminopimelate desuccinylase